MLETTVTMLEFNKMEALCLAVIVKAQAQAQAEGNQCSGLSSLTHVKFHHRSAREAMQRPKDKQQQTQSRNWFPFGQGKRNVND